MEHYAKYNDGYKYLLAVTDVFSKCTRMRPLKNKIGLEVTNAFKDIFITSRCKPELISSDKGKEFYNQHVKSIVTLYSTENEEKSCIVKRCTTMMKKIMFKYFNVNNTYHM
jgi:hypothetical protein